MSVLPRLCCFTLPLSSATELAWKVCDECVQLHGGAGFMTEYSVSVNSLLANYHLCCYQITRTFDLRGSRVILKAFLWLTKPCASLANQVSRQLADSRVTRIYGGANEIMKELIGRTCVRK